MDKIKIAAAFNEWMRRYTEEPARFEAEFQSVGRFLKEAAEGREPSYGESCAAYLDELLAGAGDAAPVPSAPAAPDMIVKNG